MVSFQEFGGATHQDMAVKFFNAPQAVCAIAFPALPANSSMLDFQHPDKLWLSIMATLDNKFLNDISDKLGSPDCQ